VQRLRQEGLIRFESGLPLSDEYQIDIPQSFIALFVKPGAVKPDRTRDFIAQRYELCEDMATMLTQTAQEMLHGQFLSEAQVLKNIRIALCSAPQEQSVVNWLEATWVVRRLAELSGWAQPDSDDFDAQVG
jgi:hypothetical protein